MLHMLPLYCRIDLAVEHCCWHSSARATTQRIAAHPAAFLLPLVFEPGERLTWQECYLSTKGWLPAAATATGRGHACSCAARSTAAAAAAAAIAAVRARGGLLCGWCGCVKFGSVLVQVANRYRFVNSSRNSEVARAQITFLPFSTGTHVIWAGYFCSYSTPGWSDRLD